MASVLVPVSEVFGEVRARVRNHGRGVAGDHTGIPNRSIRVRIDDLYLVGDLRDASAGCRERGHGCRPTKHGVWVCDAHSVSREKKINTL